MTPLRGFTHDWLMAPEETNLGLLDLSELPECVRGLRLDGNHLTLLPASFGTPGSFPQLRFLTLHNTPELNLPAEVLGPDWEAMAMERQEKPAAPRVILDYYFAHR